MNVVEGTADAVENQADADRDATLSDRLKMAGMSGRLISQAQISQRTSA